MDCSYLFLNIKKNVSYWRSINARNASCNNKSTANTGDCSETLTVALTQHRLFVQDAVGPTRLTRESLFKDSLEHGPSLITSKIKDKSQAPGAVVPVRPGQL